MPSHLDLINIYKVSHESDLAEVIQIDDHRNMLIIQVCMYDVKHLRPSRAFLLVKKLFLMLD